MLQILLVSKKIAAIKLNETIYFIRVDEYQPEIYDETGYRLNISNADTWIANQTANKYKYLHVVEFCRYWKAGYSSNFVNENLDQFIDYVILRTKAEIFTSSLASEYAEEYWIECTPQDKISTKLIHPLAKKSDARIERLGYKTISDYLNRIKKIAKEKQDLLQLNQIMRQLDIKDSIISYPATAELDHKLISKLKYDINSEVITSRLPLNVKQTMQECEKKIS